MTARAAITGIGCVTGYGIGNEVAWRGLLSGHPAANGYAHGRLTACAPTADLLAGHVAPLSGPPSARSSLLARVAAAEAWSGSGLADRCDRSRVGLLMNRNFGQHAVVSRYYETLWDQGPSAVSGFAFVQTIANSVLGQIALEHRLRGPSVLTFGTSLLATAVDLLRDGTADALLVGAVDELSALALAICDAYGLTLESRMARAVRVYDEPLTGFRPGDGAVFLVLEDERHARQRGASVIAWIRGCGSTLSLGDDDNPLLRDAADVEHALRAALDDAAVDAAAIDYVTTSAAGLPGYDDAELEALSRLGAAPVCGTAIKAAAGETWSVSVLLAVAAGAWMLQERQGLPTPDFGARAERCGLSLSRQPRPSASMRFGAILSLDPSGANDAVLLERDA